MNKLLYRLIFIITPLTFTACSKSFLEVVPLGSQVASATADYDKLMNSPYLYMARGGGGWQEEVLMGDDLAAEDGLFSTVSQHMTRLFQWQDIVYYPNDAYQRPPLLLQSLSSNQYQLNKIINEVMNSTDGTDAQKRSIRAEARATRAWCNFQLINIYAKPYLAATAASDPGFPIITQADVSATVFKRGTVQEMYDFIIKDFTESIPDLPVNPAIRTRMSKAAAEGLLGKVYLFMGRYSDALPLLNAAFNDLGTGGAKLYDYNQTLGTGGAFLPINRNTGPANGPGNNFTDLTESVLFKVYYNGGYNGNMYGNNGLVLTPQTAALFDTSDLRLQLYTNKNPDGSLNAGGRLRKYGIQYSRYGLELSELYLLRAECKARLNDLTGAVADVEILRVHRMPTADAPVPAAVAGDRVALVKFIIEERIREFAMEGYRWFDMRRLSVDPLFSGITFTHTLYNKDGSTVAYTLRQPDRLVMQLPYNFLQYNQDMPNNP
ncbi:RagB/SusD family nutrient uptake outer membrane protein [Chitinophaga eiseniae]|uniref:RagB/SusD family nutrient uptake outer membrane protein n=1 Tax=Chitinophaga eiseniae TaxID=634771 RepID=A0A847SI31_9BACT|nr:RagB/SusD family nutrient uptake outer membrane protein [Chitinophaga eiseniae]NLR78417.1 RagB/SusD family nutrient uptake outer membrane protein [Chitinophaga eiseniae]